MELNFGLCKGRHEIQNVENYIFCQEVNPLDVDGLTHTAVVALLPYAGKTVNLYVTGLTVALIAVINAAITHGIILICWHFNRESGNYYSQELRSWN